MTEFIQIQWSCGSLEEARKVSRYLVQERYVACANVIPWLESIYMWDNQLDTSQESKVYLKTRSENFDAIKEVILQNTSYELPEILSFSITDGHQEYLNWIQESTVSFAKATV
ncbi:MAG: periplasmic divalent cation tolerance protein [Chlamydiales bacterium]|jgi:periplasmic divalent cation tolerance protein